MEIQIQNGTVTFDGVQKFPTNTQLPFYVEKVDPFILNFELSGTPVAYFLSEITLNGESFSTAEGLIINYYNLLH